MTSPHEQAVQITTGKLTLEGILGLPAESYGVIVFAHARRSEQPAQGL